HNGIKNIIYHLGADTFPRIKIGIGAKPHPDYDLADWVTSPFSKDELKTLQDVAERCCEAIGLIVGGSIDEAMSRCNS
ncbi:MAG: aminoacyl-tRNA hydrolase, partial [Clostridia bacterium]|nr:aminoacyl-tRNA hydrolase [Clostridia bacterium]